MIVNNLSYIPEETVQKIKDAAELGAVIEAFVDLKKSGSSRVGKCPHCGADKLTYTPSKKVYKCWNCQKGGKDPIKFLMDVVGKDYKESLLWLAERFNVPIEAPKDQKKKAKRGNRKEKFRDQQLKASGIAEKDQKYNVSVNDTTTEICDRYQAGTIDKAWNIIAGDDMILHYIDLQGKPMMYVHNGKRRPLIRMRWANPALHKDRNGDPIKYQSPAKSGSHLWIPNDIIERYKQGQIIETLYITEGEKKADCLCINGIPAVGIMGIHNFAASGEMPHNFELLIKRCAVANIVFLLDSDWQELSIKEGKSVEQRPYTFFKAVLKFRDYFYAYNSSGISLRIYFGAGKSTVYKGVDDLLVMELQGQGAQLKEDLDKTRIGQGTEGEYVVLNDITEVGTYKLKEFWHLHSAPAFMLHHKEQLKKLRNFLYRNIQWRYNPEEDEFELVQKILPHEKFWNLDRWVDNNGKLRSKIEFKYDPCLNFLYGRGFGLHEYQRHQYRFIREQNKVVYETIPLEIRKYMIDFARQIEEPEVVELLLRGGKQYFGQDNMSNLHIRPLRFNEPQKDCMYFYFKNVYWRISADEIVQRPMKELPCHVWEDKIINFDPVLIGSLCTVERVGDNWDMKFHEQYKNCEMASFYSNTSLFAWRKYQEETTLEDGRTVIRNREKPILLTQDELDFWRSNLVAKMLAAGYVMHDYKDYSKMKAIVAMDGEESEVGKSQGGTGKSIWGKHFKHIFPIAVIDGKKKNLEDDNFLYEEVDERTGAILYDDVRVNFSFESLFSQITSALNVNKKGEKKFSIDPPKFIIATNHALNGEGNSFKRRQYTISFSDYYNGNRTVADDFGHQLFYDWDHEQWNLFYNWMATCLQVYLKFGLVYRVQGDIEERRKIRQKLGENFLSWAKLMFDTEQNEDGNILGILLNKKIEKKYLTEKYLEEYPNERKYTDLRKMKEKVMLYCDYAGLQFNPTRTGKDKRIKSDGKEYFIIADENFDASTMAKVLIHNDNELNELLTTERLGI